MTRRTVLLDESDLRGGRRRGFRGRRGGRRGVRGRRLRTTGATATVATNRAMAQHRYFVMAGCVALQMTISSRQAAAE
jgi:hypothetical protein